jgi:hypothetical protein
VYSTIFDGWSHTMPILEGPLSGRPELMLEMKQAVRSVLDGHSETTADGCTRIDHYGVYQRYRDKFAQLGAPKASARRLSNASNALDLMAQPLGKSQSYAEASASNAADRIIYTNVSYGEARDSKFNMDDKNVSDSRSQLVAQKAVYTFDEEDELLMNDPPVVSRRMVSIATFINPF